MACLIHIIHYYEWKVIPGVHRLQHLPQVTWRLHPQVTEVVAVTTGYIEFISKLLYVKEQA